MPPAWFGACEQFSIVELHPMRIQPAHERRDLLAFLGPDGEAKSSDRRLWSLLVQLHMESRELRRRENIVADQKRNRRLNDGDCKIASPRRPAVLLAEITEGERC